MTTLKVGQRVSFRPTHQKELEFNGSIVKFHADGKSADVKSEAGNGSIARIYTVGVEDCRAIEAAPAPAPVAVQQKPDTQKNSAGTE